MTNVLYLGAAWPIHIRWQSAIIRPFCIMFLKRRARRLGRPLTMLEAHRLLGFKSNSALYDKCWWPAILELREANILTSRRV